MADTPEGPGRQRHRALRGPLRGVQAVVLGAIPLLGLLFLSGVHLKLGLLVFTEQWVGLFFALAMVGIFLTFPAGKAAPRDRVPWYDLVLAAVGAVPGVHLAITYPDLVLQLGGQHVGRAGYAAIMIVLLLEAVRRTVGWTLVVVVAVFLAYARYGSYLPGLIAAQPTDWVRLLSYLYVDPNAALGLLKLAATLALAFITFGQLLLYFGVADSLTSLALLVFGRFRGGAGKASLLGSSMVGTITGAPMSNVFLTGTVTIPMMIRSGYSRPAAGGIEATVSTGGQIMPPVMGIAAFVMAENLGVPYAEVALAALIPAILFYLGVYIQVDLDAGRRGLRGLTREELPKLWATLRKGWIILPILGVLIYTLFVAGLEPAYAAAVSTLVSLLLVALIPENRRGMLRRLPLMVESAGRQLLDVVVVLAAAGLVVGVAAVSGLGFRIGYSVLEMSQSGGIWAVLLISAVASLLLGMGTPTVAAYALVAVLVAPAMIDFGVSPMAAHMFIFYFAIVSNITPPIALAAFAAAPLAGASPLRTALAAMRTGVLIYIVPFLFVFHPALLLDGAPQDILIQLLLAAAGALILGIAIAGHLTRPLSPLRRGLGFVAAIGLLLPATGPAVMALRWSALALAVLMVLAEWAPALVNRMRSSATAPPTTPVPPATSAAAGTALVTQSDDSVRGDR